MSLSTVSQSWVKSAGQLKCMYNKQEELEATVQQESYDAVSIMETWWDNLYDWSAAMDC